MRNTGIIIKSYNYSVHCIYIYIFFNTEGRFVARFCHLYITRIDGWALLFKSCWNKNSYRVFLFSTFFFYCVRKLNYNYSNSMLTFLIINIWLFVCFFFCFFYIPLLFFLFNDTEVKSKCNLIKTCIVSTAFGFSFFFFFFSFPILLRY